MTLCLVRVQPPGSDSAAASAPLVGTNCLEVALDPHTNRTGDLWHICVHGVKALDTMMYGWRADSDVTWEGEATRHSSNLVSRGRVRQHRTAAVKCHVEG